MEHIFMPSSILLPAHGTDMTKWAALACDQFTSEPEYWQKAEEITKNEPSTLHIVLPEVYLEKPDKSVRIGKIHENMKSIAQQTLTNEVNGFVYVRRTTASGVREGIVGVVDLENYSYEKGAMPLIRPTEKTVVDRIPPRIAVRRGANLEAPHILMLVDDNKKELIEPFGAKCSGLEKLYDFELMLNGGHIEGYAITDESEINRICTFVDNLQNQNVFDEKYPQAKGKAPMAIAVGDGNHSLATAKAFWEELKNTLSNKELNGHPARYCLVELVNIHCDAIIIEPIHRVVFGTTEKELLEKAKEFFAEQGATLLQKNENDAQNYKVLTAKTEKPYCLKNSAYPLAVGSIDAFLTSFLSQNLGTSVDFVHDEASVKALCKKGAVGILLPQFDKSDIFKGVILGGVLPKKTFSMGTAREKRYYLECRKIR